MTRTVKMHTKEFKEETVRLSFKFGSVKNTVNELEIPKATFARLYAD